METDELYSGDGKPENKDEEPEKVKEEPDHKVVVLDRGNLRFYTVL